MITLAAAAVRISVPDMLVEEAAVRFCGDECLINIGRNSEVGVPPTVSEAHEHRRELPIVTDLIDRFGFDLSHDG